MAKTDCSVLIINHTQWDMVIDIHDSDDLDWMDGPRTVLDGKVVYAKSSGNYTLRSKDEYTRCWFEMNNKFYNHSKGSSDKDAFHIGMTHIELKTNDRDHQARKDYSTETYTELKIKVTIDMETPVSGKYSLTIQYDEI